MTVPPPERAGRAAPLCQPDKRRTGSGQSAWPAVPQRRGISAVVRKIERDTNRFKQIVRGKIKNDLRKYITHGEMIGKTGGELVSIPMPQIEIPEFRYGSKNSGG